MNVTATLFGQMLTFVVFVWFIKAYLWEPLTKAMEDRSNKIAEGLAAAEQGQQKIEQAKIEFTTRIDEAKTKASTIIGCLLYTSPSPRDGLLSRMPSSA